MTEHSPLHAQFEATPFPNNLLRLEKDSYAARDDIFLRSVEESLDSFGAFLCEYRNLMQTSLVLYVNLKAVLVA